MVGEVFEVVRSGLTTMDSYSVSAVRPTTVLVFQQHSQVTGLQHVLPEAVSEALFGACRVESAGPALVAQVLQEKGP